MKERTIAMLWALGVFALLLFGEFLMLQGPALQAITALSGVIIGYYFARDANGTHRTG